MFQQAGQQTSTAVGRPTTGETFKNKKLQQFETDLILQSKTFILGICQWSWLHYLHKHKDLMELSAQGKFHAGWLPCLRLGQDQLNGCQMSSCAAAAAAGAAAVAAAAAAAGCPASPCQMSSCSAEASQQPSE